VSPELFDVLEPAVVAAGLELVDVELRAAVVRVVVDRAGGVDVDALAEVSRGVSEVLDRHDPVPGHRYTLEVSSPGVERPLRTPAQFARAVGETVTVRTVAGGEGERRITGRLAVADAEGIVVIPEDAAVGGDDHTGAGRRLAYHEVERARTVFEWGGASRPGPDGRRGSVPRRRAQRSRGGEREQVTERVTRP
jgi:ribosome maturation factor RimP